jgi:hypothetical protein
MKRIIVILAIVAATCLFVGGFTWDGTTANAATSDTIIFADSLEQAINSCLECEPPKQCENLIDDNNADGTDYPNDPGCDSPQDDLEATITNPPPPDGNPPPPPSGGGGTSDLPECPGSETDPCTQFSASNTDGVNYCSAKAGLQYWNTSGVSRHMEATSFLDCWQALSYYTVQVCLLGRPVLTSYYYPRCQEHSGSLTRTHVETLIHYCQNTETTMEFTASGVFEIWWNDRYAVKYWYPWAKRTVRGLSATIPGLGCRFP